MIRQIFAITVLFSAAFSVPTIAKSPVAADEQLVREIIGKVYEGYSRSTPDTPTAEEAAATEAVSRYEPPYSATLTPLIKRWTKLMEANDELYNLNSFDWYCQCQDYDNSKAKIVRQTYKAAGKDRIDANVIFSAGWNAKQPLLFRFKREGGAWKLDDLKFHSSGTLRGDLASDIKDAEKDLKAKK
jgi:Protein of unknown function (DUF3828)